MVRGRWLVVLLLAFATAGVIPQLDDTTGNAIALIGIATVGILCVLKLESISVLQFPFSIYLLLATLMVFQFIVNIIQTENITIVQLITPPAYLLVATTTVLIVPNTIDAREAIMGGLIAVTAICGAGIFGILVASPIIGIQLTELEPVDEFIIFGAREFRPVAISIFANPNRLSAFAIAGVIGGGGIWYTERNVYGLFAAAVAILTIVLTGSRTPFFAIPMAFITASLLWLKFRRVLVLWTGVFALAVPIVVSSTVVDPSLVSQISHPRAELWAGSVQAIAEKPLFGYGFGNSPAALQDFVPTNWSGLQPHNSYVKIAVAGGLPVGFLYGMLLFSSIISRARAGVPKLIAIWLVLSFSYLSVQMFESFSIFSLTPTCLLIGLSTGYIIQHQESQLKDSR